MKAITFTSYKNYIYETVDIQGIIKPRAGRWLYSTVPTLPGCITYGENVDEALLMAKEAIGLYIESLVTHNEPVPDEIA